MAGVFALSLAACQAEQPTYEADAEDVSGGDLIVSPDDPANVPVNVPETPMTPVPDETASAADTAAE
ncbi:hypothetical protein GRI32_06175 [Altererythrobacter aestuarii]|uniref:Uncharacterized protein n=1 Tax=Alteraurantiacibacter aestuarii TaxID=650004 RepID=A0A844ZIK9_9SPHN|nr:hypothetical protein [Alteraurantiacibacter aestuarii]